MQRSIRPRGLATLAIINFILAGIKGFFLLPSLSMVRMIHSASESASYVPGMEFSQLVLIFSLTDFILIVLLILSGIGYLRVHRILGLLLGNIFAGIGLMKGCAAVISWSELSSPINIFNSAAFLIISDFVFPLLTILFLNFIFFNTWRTRHPFFERLEALEEQKKAPAAVPQEPATEKKPTPHILLVFGQGIRQTLRGSQGIFFLYFSIILFLIIGQIVIWTTGFQGGFAANNSQNNESSRLMMISNSKERAKDFFTWVLDEKDTAADTIETDEESDDQDEAVQLSRWTAMMSLEQPAMLSLIFSIIFSLLPVIIAFSTYNQISEDAGRKGYRYLLLRTTRKSIFFGKYLSVLAIVIPLIIVVVFSISLFIYFIYGLYPLGQTLFFSIWTIFAFIMLSIPATAFCVMVSSLINSGVMSLFTSIGILAIGPLILRIIKDFWSPVFVLQYLLPGKAAYFLFHYEWWAIILAVITMAVYTALFLFAGYSLFKRKSL